MGQWVGSGHITKNQINLELIAVIQLCLKICGWVDGWVNGWGQVKH